jgi:hypothetical protein
MNPADSPFYAAQDEVLRYLAAQPVLQPAHFVARREGQLISDVWARRAKIKLACFVYPVVPGTVNPNVPGPQFGDSQLRVGWWEDPDLNHDGPLSSDRAAYETLRLLHHWKPNDLERYGLIKCQPDPLEWELTKEGLEHWDCWFDWLIKVPPLER